MRLASRKGSDFEGRNRQPKLHLFAAIGRFGVDVTQFKGDAYSVMHTRKNGKSDRGTNRSQSEYKNPVRGGNLPKQNQRNSNDLRHGVGLPPPAWLENTDQAGGPEQSADDHNDDVTGEDQYGHAPGNLVRGGEHQEHGAEQELVSNGIKVLPQDRPLFEQAGEQPVQAVADSGHNEQSQGPDEVVFQHRDHGERNKDQAQQGEQVGGGEQLRNHPSGPWKNRLADLPALAANCSASEGIPPFAASSSTRSTRCMGKKTALAEVVSPDFTSWAKSS